ncbi:MAG: hypothetical protein ACREIC_19250, partial [Limisphaerales bacterium]
VTRIYESLAAQERRVPARPFRSPARAQFWFEWRRVGAKLVFYSFALSAVPVFVLAASAIYFGRLPQDETFGLGLYLLVVPPFIHFVHGVSPERKLSPFLATRPLTDGELVFARLKMSALSAALSWVVTLLLLCLVPLFGDVAAAIKHSPPLLQNLLDAWPLLPVALLGLMFLTWRFAVADLWLVLAGDSWVAKAPVLKIYAVMAVIGVISSLAGKPGFLDRLPASLPIFLALAVVLKGLLAQWAFRAALRRHLLTRSAILKYLALLTCLAGIFLFPTWAALHGETWLPSLDLGVILLLPMARIGCAPLVLSRARHPSNRRRLRRSQPCSAVPSPSERG